MDSRVEVLTGLGLEPGDAHVLRNAGAVATDDMLRSLVLSQRTMKTTAVAIVAHTDCGLRKVDDAELARELAQETGLLPPFAFGSFQDLDEHVRLQVEEVRKCPWLPFVDDVRGYIYDVSDGSVRPVE
jgi:carbonic anhydrase